jgi:hypothetical protein
VRQSNRAAVHITHGVKAVVGEDVEGALAHHEADSRAPDINLRRILPDSRADGRYHIRYLRENKKRGRGGAVSQERF